MKIPKLLKKILNIVNKQLKKDIINQYGLPLKVKYCIKCTVSNQRPRITFDKSGICSACNFKKIKDNIDWKKREEQLALLLDKHRKTDGGYDVIVPCSGGKDGSFVAHQLKSVYRMNPLCVTWSPIKSTEIGLKNLNSFINSGFNHILGKANPKVMRQLTKLSFEYLGDPFQPFIYGVSNFPLRIALSYDVRLIMYGENSEVEYGGDMKNSLSPIKNISENNYLCFSGIPPEFWLKHKLSNTDIYPFLAPEYNIIKKKKIEQHYFGYYKFWDPQENYYYAKTNTGFEPNPERTQGTYSKYASLDDELDGFHYYLAYIKFGIGRATSDSAHEIRDNKINREEGVELVRRYDNEFPSKYFDIFLNYCGITEGEFNTIIDSWRSDHIWKKNNNKWELRYPIWEDN